MRFAADSDPGRVRGHNEDAFAANPALGVWMVADGMGGHARGEVASAMVVDTVTAGISNDGSLRESVLGAHHAIEAAAAEHPDQHGMGSTVVVLKVSGIKSDLVWVGDSRAYRWHAGSLHRLTRDHSLVEALIDEGRISRKQAEDHLQRNVITQTLGLGHPKPSCLELDLAAGDWILMCSDGLTDELSDAQIAEVLATSTHPRGAVSALIAQANSHGGRDNICVVIVEPQRAGRWRRWAEWAPVLLGGVAALAVAAVIWLLRAS